MPWQRQPISFQPLVVVSESRFSISNYPMRLPCGGVVSLVPRLSINSGGGLPLIESLGMRLGCSMKMYVAAVDSQLLGTVLDQVEGW